MKPGDETHETLDYRSSDPSSEYVHAQRALGLQILVFACGQFIAGFGGVLLHGTRIAGFGILLFWLALLGNFALTLIFSVCYVHRHEVQLRFGLDVMSVLISLMLPVFVCFVQVCMGMMVFGSW